MRTISNTTAPYPWRGPPREYPWTVPRPASPYPWQALPKLVTYPVPCPCPHHFPYRPTWVPQADPYAPIITC